MHCAFPSHEICWHQLQIRDDLGIVAASIHTMNNRVLTALHLTYQIRLPISDCSHFHPSLLQTFKWQWRFESDRISREREKEKKQCQKVTYLVLSSLLVYSSALPNLVRKFMHARYSLKLFVIFFLHGYNPEPRNYISYLRYVRAYISVGTICYKTYSARQNFIALFMHGTFTVRSKNTIYSGYNWLYPHQQN